MYSIKTSVAAAFCCALVSHISSVVASEGVVLFVDNSQGSYLRAGSPNIEKPWTPSTVGVSTAILLGIPPLTLVDAEVSAELNELLVPELFNRPQHVFSLVVAGNAAEKASQDVFPASVQRRALATPLRERAQTPAERTMAASMILHEMAMVPRNAGKEVEHFFLGCSADCDAECIDIQLEKLAESEELDFSMEAAEDHGMGSFSFGGETFELTKRADRAFAMEVACLLHQVSTLSTPSDTEGKRADRSLFTGLITSPQEIEEEYGEASSKAIAASALVMKVVDMAIKTAQEAYSGRLVGSVVLVGSVPSSSLETLSTQLEATQSVRLLAQAGGADDLGSRLINQVTMFTIGIILLITLGLATCALCCMPITRETLLYSGVKLD